MLVTSIGNRKQKRDLTFDLIIQRLSWRSNEIQRRLVRAATLWSYLQPIHDQFAPPIPHPLSRRSLRTDGAKSVLKNAKIHPILILWLELSMQGLPD